MLPEIPDLPQELQRLLDQIPPGRVTTPGQLAAALGSPMAARWIGHWLLHHAHSSGCPCHRVVRAGGVIGSFVEKEAAKARRLRAEGVPVRKGIVDLGRFGFDRFVCDHPLEKLRQFQESIAARVSLRPPRRLVKLVAGVDVAYPAPGEGTAAYALVDVATGKLVWSTAIRRPVAFPYITSFLTFRELPILLDLLAEADRAGQTADVLLVDGSGILHPRHAGIATHLGVVADRPAIGVTKKLLCGRVEIAGMTPLESRPVVYEDRLIGAAIRPTAGSRRPIFISPGNRIDLAMAERLVRRLLLGRRLPEPLYWADAFSRRQ